LCRPGEVWASADEEILDVLPAEEILDVLPAKELPPARDEAPAIGGQQEPAFKGPEELGLSQSQWDVYVYLSNTLKRYRSALTPKSLTIDYLRLPFQLALVGGAVYLGLLVIHKALALLGEAVGEWVGYGLYLAPLFVLVVGIALRYYMEECPVGLGTEPETFSLGRFDSIFNSMTQAIFGVFFIACFISQMAVLQWTPNHGGLSVEIAPTESFLLSLDNACCGLFFDTFELFDVHVGDKVEHTGFSATVFWLFRLAYSGLALIIVYDLYQKYRFRNFLTGSPEASAGPAALAAWIERLCGDRGAWPRRYCDEVLFLYLAAKFLRGDFPLVRLFGRYTQWLRVEEGARALFLGPDNYYLLIWR
jgi:hypothetical protein